MTDIFTPLQIKGKTLKNRIVMEPQNALALLMKTVLWAKMLYRNMKHWRRTTSD